MKTLLEYSNISQSEKKMEKDLTKKKKDFPQLYTEGLEYGWKKIFPLLDFTLPM
jgi:hypothetical protein